MPTTVAASFDQLKSNLEPTGLQKSTVSGRQQVIRETIEAELVVKDSFLTGSYARNTLIAPLSEADIDIFVVLDPSYHAQGPANLLERVRQVLLKRYPNAPRISRNGQAVTIRFTDFVVDVVPGFYRENGGYLIPNTNTGAWISTNPKIHAELMTKSNEAHNGDMVPLVKMIKAWNRKIGDGFVSFYLEMLALQILQGVRIDDFPSAVRFFFDKGREAVKYAIQDPVEYGGKIYGLQTITTVESAVSAFTTGFLCAQSGEGHSAQGREQKAITEWKIIFGDYFPTYGW